MQFLIRKLLYITLYSFLFRSAIAQKGLPAKIKTKAEVATSFPQHEDFSPVLLKRLAVAEGFTVNVAASGLGKPRMMEIPGEGALYITRRDLGDVILLQDKDRDGKFDEMQPVVIQFPGVHGIAIKERTLYLCSNRELKKYTINADYTLKDTVTIFKDLPDGGQHGNRSMAFGPDGKLYLSVGSDCNDCNESNPEHATMLVIDPESASRHIYARGLRNTIGFDWHPVTKELWGADNGTDWRGDEKPPEELNQIKEGAHYGWPMVFGKREIDETREDPPGSTKAAFAKTTEAAVLTFPAHSAPINLKFLDKANGFPAEMKDDALVSWHGSWNKDKPDGYKVQIIHFENGRPSGAEDFLSGFLSADGSSRFGRPAGIAVSPKGIIYISDDANGVIYAVSKK